MGMTQVVDGSVLWLETRKVKRVLFNVTLSPRNGALTLASSSSPSHVLRFTSRDLSSKKLFYSHDGSETQEDSFQFVAFSEDDSAFFYFGEVRMRILLRNDNPPRSAKEGVNVLQVSDG